MISVLGGPLSLRMRSRHTFWACVRSGKFGPSHIPYEVLPRCLVERAGWYMSGFLEPSVAAASVNWCLWCNLSASSITLLLSFLPSVEARAFLSLSSICRWPSEVV